MPLEDEVPLAEVIEEAPLAVEDTPEAFFPDVPQVTQPVAPKPAAPKPAAKPVQQPAPAAQAKPPVQETRISNDLLDLAESYGIPRAEAESYGDPAHLIRTVRLISKQRPSETPKPEKPAEKPEELPFAFPDVEALKKDGFEGPLTQMAASMKAMHEFYQGKLKAMQESNEKTLEPLKQAEMQRRFAHIDTMIGEAVTAAGHDAAQLTREKRGQIYNFARSLAQAHQQNGVQIDDKQLFQMAAPLVLGQQQVQEPTVPTPPKSQVRQQAAAAQDRNVNGTFAGVPTHRRVAAVAAAQGALRSTLIDQGRDPGQQVNDTDDGRFLPG